MNKFFKVGCLLILFLALLGIAGVFLANRHDGPTQSIAFLNTSDVTRSVTFEKIEKTGKLAATYTINRDIKPNQEIIEKVPAGNYKISIWNQDKSLFKSTDFKVILDDPKVSSYQLYRLDIATDKIYVIVNLNALYEGNSLANHMASAAGTKQERLKIEMLFDGGRPFQVPETYTSRTFIDINDDLPSEIKFGEMVYGLFEFSKTISKDKVEAAIYAKLLKKVK
ncbi:hypothetical protein ACFPVY_03305 [Flavobacterium qiangtangense]|uniref:DUF2846 domain-containing protein n=1 Tax=Flavobacterium qiangtangense TaxID=1442595 RepID=A0ABW1PLK9_9FLAO